MSLCNIKISTPREGDFLINVNSDYDLTIKQTKSGERGKWANLDKNAINNYPIGFFRDFFGNAAIVQFLKEKDVSELKFRVKLQSPFNYHCPSLSFKKNEDQEVFLFLSADKNNFDSKGKFWLLSPNAGDIESFNKENNAQKRRLIIRGKMKEVRFSEGKLNYRSVSEK